MERRPLDSLPSWYWQVPYVGDRVPGAVARDNVALGANCQLWAYAVLDYFGSDLPDFRSDELWYDVDATQRVDDPRPLDLILFNGDHDPFGAHVGLWTGAAVAHLCNEVGRPVTWPLAEFEARSRYAIRIGFKRPIGRAE